jgi:ATP-dependent Lhr-like helicase
VLVQHVLSAGLGDGFRADELLAEIRGAVSFRDLTDAEFAWILDFATTGGSTLRAYPEFRKLVRGDDGVYRFAVPKLARAHRMNIGTIVGEAGVSVRFQRGAKLGTIDEGFVTKLKPGEIFRFAGKTLELVHLRDLVAIVKLASGRETAATVWGGNALPISEGLSRPVREILGEVAASNDPALGDFPAEVRALRAPFAIQRTRSAIPAEDETLVERLKSRDGYHLFVYTWEGRSVNEGLGHLLAYRLARNAPNTVAVSANDHGFECLAVAEFPEDSAIAAAFSPEGLDVDVAASLNYPEMAKRAFREIARIAGLVHTGVPGERKNARHLQMSASLLFDVFRNYDPGHPLLREAYREVNRSQLELPRLRALLERIARGRLRFARPGSLTPFAFPLYVDRVRSRPSTESLADRIERIRRKVFEP